MVHTCNPSYFGGGDWGMRISLGNLGRFHIKIEKKGGAGNIAQLWNAYLVYKRLWVQFRTPPKNKKADYRTVFKRNPWGSVEIAQQFRALVLLQRSWVQVSAPIWLTVIPNFSSRWSDAFFWASQVPGMHTVYKIHKCKTRFLKGKFMTMFF